MESTSRGLLSTKQKKFQTIFWGTQSYKKESQEESAKPLAFFPACEDILSDFYVNQSIHDV
ncbi:hypothetical protein SAMN05444380_11427 [Thermophagus xiamenensis]|jgi:hypothetical protein|uniref:Uncharacterized protein n=1 Tax=Thermophagus xiamenensis TaxID=385682 RepID=A0A1I2BSL7_9BACT|nr:hypothetical protein SAMN05444380_11427 [Thermophagus xiamenensis]